MLGWLAPGRAAGALRFILRLFLNNNAPIQWANSYCYFNPTCAEWVFYLLLEECSDREALEISIHWHVPFNLFSSFNKNNNSAEHKWLSMQHVIQINEFQEMQSKKWIAFVNPRTYFLPKSRCWCLFPPQNVRSVHGKLNLEMRNGHKAEYMNDNEHSASCSATLFFTNPKSKMQISFLLHHRNLMIISFRGRAIISATRISHFAVVLLFYKGIRLFAAILLLHYSWKGAYI